MRFFSYNNHCRPSLVGSASSTQQDQHRHPHLVRMSTLFAMTMIALLTTRGSDNHRGGLSSSPSFFVSSFSPATTRRSVVFERNAGSSSSSVPSELLIAAASRPPSSTRRPTLVQSSWYLLRMSAKSTRLSSQAPGADADDGSFDEEEETEDDETTWEEALRRHRQQQTDGGSKASKWKLPNDFEIFLTQCSIQTFLFLLKSLRDPQTVLWVEKFTQPSITEAYAAYAPSGGLETNSSDRSKLLLHHGLGAINETIFSDWGSYFEQLLQQPEQTYTVTSEHKHIPDYDWEVKPASLCSRIISVREQIAREFVIDLGVLANMGGRTLDGYWTKIGELRALAKMKQQEDSGGNGGANNGDNGGVGPTRENLLFLGYPSRDKDGNEFAPSPLRKGNFDLLCLLATQEAVHRVLNNNDRQGPTPELLARNNYLTNFYANRLTSHFVGAQRYGRADDFLEELLSETPRLMEVGDGSDDTSSLIDPTRIAELILEEREKVCLEWQEICRNVPQSHMHIKRMQLNLLMGISSPAGSDGDGYDSTSSISSSSASEDETPQSDEGMESEWS